MRVVAADIIPSLSPYDDKIVSSLGCDVVRASWSRPWTSRVARGLRRRLARMIARLFRDRIPLSIASRAHHALTPALARAAIAQRADLYIAHNLAALPAAAEAARKRRSKLGFDAEDYHCGELDNNPGTTLELRIRRSIERELLPRCTHLTSASPSISQAYAADYRVNMTPILNVFPLSEGPQQPIAPDGIRHGTPSLYWFSQTIGPHRGLEQLLAAMARMGVAVRLLLRGNPAAGYLDSLRQLAMKEGGETLVARLRFLPVAAPHEMVRLAAEHDLGLGIEPGCDRNNELALSNKIFIYLLAGVPVLLSRTPAQTALAQQLGAAALLVDIHKPDELAQVLDDYFADPERQRSARAQAWHISRERFNWDKEKVKFLEAVNHASATDA